MKLLIELNVCLCRMKKLTNRYLTGLFVFLNEQLTTNHFKNSFNFNNNLTLETFLNAVYY